MAELHGKVDSIGSEVGSITAALRGLLEEGRVSKDRKIKTLGTQVVQSFLGDLLGRLDRVNSDLADIGKVTSHISPPPPVHGPDTPLSYNSPVSQPALPPDGPPPHEKALDQPNHQNQQIEQQSLEQQPNHPPHHQPEQQPDPQPEPHPEESHQQTEEEPKVQDSQQHQANDVSPPEDDATQTETCHHVEPQFVSTQTPAVEAEPLQSELPTVNTVVSESGIAFEDQTALEPVDTARASSIPPSPSLPVDQQSAHSDPSSHVPTTLSNGSVYLDPVIQDRASPMFSCAYKDVNKLNEELFERYSSHPVVRDRGYFKLQVRDLPPLAVHEVSRPGKFHATSFTYQIDQHGLVKVDTGKKIRFKAPHLPFPTSKKKHWTFEEQKELWNSSAARPPRGSRPYIIGNPLFEDIDLHPGEKLKRRGRTVLEGINTQYVYFNLTGKTITTMHREDAHVRSENLLRSGEHKFWCFIKPAFAAKFEERMQLEYREMRRCSQAVRHLSRHIPPSVLEAWGIEYTLDYCYPGQAVVTEPGTYHQVLNLGPNYALAVNMEYESSPDHPPNYKFCDNHCPDKFAMKAADFRLYEELYNDKWGERSENGGPGVRSSMAIQSSMAPAAQSSMLATKRSSMAPTSRSSMAPAPPAVKRKRGRPPKAKPIPEPEVSDVSMTDVPMADVSMADASSQPAPISISVPEPEGPLQAVTFSGELSKPGADLEPLSQHELLPSEKPSPLPIPNQAPTPGPVQSVTPPPEQSVSSLSAPALSESAPSPQSSSNGRELETPSPAVDKPHGEQHQQRLQQQQKQDDGSRPVAAEETPVRPPMATPAPTVAPETRTAPSLPAFLQRPLLYAPIPERPEPLRSSSLSSIRGLAPPPNFLGTPISCLRSPARGEQDPSTLPPFHNHHFPSGLSAPLPAPDPPSRPDPPSQIEPPSQLEPPSRPAPTPFRKTARMLGNKRPAEASPPPSLLKKPRLSKTQSSMEPRFAPKPQVTEALPTQHPMPEPHFVLASPLSESPSLEESPAVEIQTEERCATGRQDDSERQDFAPLPVLQPPQMMLQYHPEAEEGSPQSPSDLLFDMEDQAYAGPPETEPMSIPLPQEVAPEPVLDTPPEMATAQLNTLIHSSVISRFISSPDQVCGKPAFDRLARLFEGWRGYCKSSHVELGGINLVNLVEQMPGDNPELYTFLVRFCKMRLAEKFDGMPKGRRNSARKPEDAMNALLAELDWDESQRHRLHDYLREGKCWLTLTDRFEGLLPILPSGSDAEALELALFEDQVKSFQKQLKTVFAKKLCAVGKTLQDSIWNCRELPEYVFESAYRPWFTVQQIMPLLKKFTLLKETFYDAKLPYHWGLRPSKKWSLFWGWPSNPVAVPAHVRWCDAPGCRRRMNCRCVSRLIPDVPRISINGPRGPGIRAVGSFKPGEILGELTGEIVPAGMFAGSGEWTWEIRRPDVDGDVVGEIWPRERGNWVRLVPHSLTPTAEYQLKKMTGMWRTVLVALDTIKDGDEITVKCGWGYDREQLYALVEGLQ